MDTLLASIDRLIALLERKRISRTISFDDDVEPLFLELAHSHGTYLAGLDEVCHTFWDGTAPADIAVKTAKQRLELQQLRTRVNSLAHILADEKRFLKNVPEEILRFVRSVAEYLQVGAGHGTTLKPEPGYGFRTTLLDLIGLAENQVFNPKDCAAWAESLWQDARNRWSDVTIAYGATKDRYLKTAGTATKQPGSEH